MKIFITLIFCVVLLSACGKIPTEFNAPSWQTDLYLPIISKQYSLDTLIAESDNIVQDNTGDYPILKIVIDTLEQKYCIRDLVGNTLGSETLSVSIPAVSGQKSFDIPFTNNVRIDSLCFENGDLYFKLENKTSGNLFYEINIPGLKNPQWIPFSLKGTLAKSQVFEQTFNLTAYSYSAIAGGNLRDAIKCIVQSDCDNNTGSLDFRTRINNGEIDYFAGAISSQTPKSVNETIQTSISDNIRRIAKGISFTEPVFELEVMQKSKYNDFYDILLENTNMSVQNYSGATLNLQSKSGANPFSSILVENAHFRKRLDNSNSNFADVIKLMPNIFKINSLITLNPSNEVGKISKNDSMLIKGVITLGSKLRIDSLEAIDTIKIDLPQDTRDLITSALWAKIFFYAQNALPFECVVIMKFTDDDYKTLFTKSITVKPADYLSEQSIPAETSDTLDLSEQELIKLANSHNIIAQVIVNSNFGKDSSYELKPKDFIKVKAKCRVKYNVDL